MDQGRGTEPQGDGSLGEGQEGSITLSMPAADPSTYLSWMAYWREVEAMMLERPALEELGSSEAAPFLHGSIARFLSDVVGETTRQATRALSERRETFSPLIEVPASPGLRAEMASYIERRADWLSAYAQAIGVDRMPPPEESLRREVIDVFRGGVDG